MNINLTEENLPVFEALASPVRIKIIHLLAQKSMNVRELAEALSLSSAIMTMHVKKLEKAEIIRSEMLPGRGGAAQKVCSLKAEGVAVIFPERAKIPKLSRRTEVSVGHYTDLHIAPTCGIGTVNKVIGSLDDPRYFLDPERLNAKILWFSQGYVEYKIPNFLLASEEPDELEISMEISSEAPHTNNNWPSDISFLFNGQKIGMWTSPGDSRDMGKFNPPWWFEDMSQSGLMKRISIRKDGTFMDGMKLSDVTIDEVDIRHPYWSFRIEVPVEAEHVGGVTLFGSGFGNYNQDLVFKLYYSKGQQQTDELVNTAVENR
ncbi:ArsR/SmtB family transcription factor [Paenibacillus sp. GCM10023252]|uniref:ArsR/SmtB family transcription factor n=1 Tax=Paenibacillus sp. GCM10023252 TaxID=3252649 RepID=UPI0036176197